MSDNKLLELSFEFAVAVINLADSIKTPKSSYMIDQFARAGTSVGANIHEAQYAHSKADFISKLEIALNEGNGEYEGVYHQQRGRRRNTMNINKTINGSDMTVALEGRLDTTTAPELEESLKDSLPGVKELTFDLQKLEYVSSAGLRVLLSTQKIMNGQGAMKVVNVCDMVMEVFDVTGFSDILTIE